MAQFIFEPLENVLAFEWDLMDIDGATHFLDKTSSGIWTGSTVWEFC